jgi:hypothetical protein
MIASFCRNSSDSRRGSISRGIRQSTSDSDAIGKFAVRVRDAVRQPVTIEHVEDAREQFPGRIERPRRCRRRRLRRGGDRDCRVHQGHAFTSAAAAAASPLRTRRAYACT